MSNLFIMARCEEYPDRYEIKKAGINIYDFIEKDTLLKFDTDRANIYCLVVLYFEMNYVETDPDLYCPIHGCRGRNDSITKLNWKIEEFNFEEINDSTIYEAKSGSKGVSSDIRNSNGSYLNTFFAYSIYGLDLKLIKDIYNSNEQDGIDLFKGAHFDDLRISFATLINKTELLTYIEQYGMPEVVVETITVKGSVAY
jgi:hypothetical protein